MEKDLRYGHVNSLFVTNRVKNFTDIFEAIPRKVVYTDLDINYKRWLGIVAEPDLLSVRELVRFATLIEIDPNFLTDVIYQEGKKHDPVLSKKDKDLRYGHVNSLFVTDRIKSFVDIFQAIPHKIVYTDLDTNYKRWLRIVREPDLLSVREVVRFASLIEIDPKILMELIYKEGEKVSSKKS